MEERRTDISTRNQINRIEFTLDKLFNLVNGEGQEIGLKDKVNIMWGYRNLFTGVIVANVFTILFFIINSFRIH